MSDVFFDLQEQLRPALHAGDTAHCQRVIGERLAGLPSSPFHVALDLAITNPVSAVAAHLDGFLKREAARFEVGAAYVEMNGFDINPDRWFFDAFAFRHHGGHDDYDWLADWQSEEYDDMTVTGLERLQAVYASAAFRDPRFKDASYVAGPPGRRPVPGPDAQGRTPHARAARPPPGDGARLRLHPRVQPGPPRRTGGSVSARA